MNWSDIELIWREGHEPPEGVEAIVRSDIAAGLRLLDAPSDLVFHTVFLSDDIENGPCVVISGFPGRDDAFDAGYYTR